MKIAVFRPLASWLLSYPVLAGVAATLLLVCYRVLLVGVGLPDLFWHDDAFPQAQAGLGVGLLLADLGLTGFLLDALQPWSASLKRRGETQAMLHALLRYMARTSGLLFLAAVPAALWAPKGTPSFILPLTAGVSGLFYALLVIQIWTRWRFPLRLLRKLPALRSWVAQRRLPSPFPALRLDALALVLFLIRTAFFVSLMLLPIFVDVSPALPLSLLLGNVVAAYGFFVFAFPVHRFGILAGLLLAWVGLDLACGPTHRIREMGDAYHDRVWVTDVAKVPPAQSGLLEDGAVLSTWTSLRGRAGPLVVVAADGGGLRAAMWTASVLTTLEHDLDGFPYQVRLITGASGGMLGAAYWTATLQEPGRPLHAAGGEARDRAGLLSDLSHESLSPVVRRLVFHDLIPFLTALGADRGDVQQVAWERQTRGALARTFRSLAAGEQAGWRPSLVLSPMMAEDGRRLLVSNLELSHLAELRLGQDASARYTRQAVQFYRMFPGGAPLKLATAVRMNATFPYLSPAIELPTRPPRSMVDAGFYDEHGVDLAGMWLLQHVEELTDPATGPRSIVLVELPDKLASLTKEAPCDPGRPQWGRGLSDLLTPARALRAGWDAAMAYRNDELIAELTTRLGPRFHATSFEPSYRVPVNAEEPHRCGRPEGEIAMSWRLTRAEVESLMGGIDDQSNCAKRRQLAAWWQESGGSARGEPLGCAAAAP